MFIPFCIIFLFQQFKRKKLREPSAEDVQHWLTNPKRDKSRELSAEDNF